MVILFQFSEEPPYSFPQWLQQITFPPTVQKGSLFSTPSPAFVICRLYLFIFGCVGSSLLRTDFLQLWHMGFSLRWLLLLRSTGSRLTGFSSCGSWGLEHTLNSCGAWAKLLRDLWDLPRPELEPVSPALAGGFLTTVSPGKSLQTF